LFLLAPETAKGGWAPAQRGSGADIEKCCSWGQFVRVPDTELGGPTGAQCHNTRSGSKAEWAETPGYHCASL